MNSLVLVLVFLNNYLVMGDYECSLKSTILTCSGLSDYDISAEFLAKIGRQTITELRISNGNISIISNQSMENYPALQSLFIENSHVANLEDGIFLHCPGLQEISLKKNQLKMFNWKSLPINNNNNNSMIKFLDLSENKLENLSGFSKANFPKLAMLDLTNNFLTHLPLDLIKLLNEENKFNLLIDNNPWNCSHPNWKENLTERLIKIFCYNKSFEYDTTTSSSSTPSRIRSEFLKIEENQNNSKMIMDHALVADNNNTCESSSINCYKCSFYYCLLWLFCGIWVGIILGNIFKIRNLLCSRPATFSDQYTQCDFSLIEQHMISGVMDGKTRKFTPISALATTS